MGGPGTRAVRWCVVAALAAAFLASPVIGRSASRSGWSAFSTQGLHLVADDGRLQYWSDSNRPDVAVFVDDRTGKRSLIAGPSGSQLGPLGGGWVSFVTSPSFRGGPPGIRLYSPERRRWVTVTVTAAQARWLCPRSSPRPGGVHIKGRRCEAHLAGVGRDWTALDGVTRTIYGRIGSSRTVRVGPRAGDWAKPTATRRIDLDAPNLVRPICAPLRDPLGGLQFLGRFALAPIGPGFALERCGTYRKLVLAGTRGGVSFGFGVPLMNERAVVWQTRPGWLHELLLPSLRAIQVRMPKPLARLLNLDFQFSLVLGRDRLYLDFGARGWSRPIG